MSELLEKLTHEEVFILNQNRNNEGRQFSALGGKKFIVNKIYIKSSFIDNYSLLHFIVGSYNYAEIPISSKKYQMELYPNEICINRLQNFGVYLSLNVNHLYPNYSITVVIRGEVYR